MTKKSTLKVQADILTHEISRGNREAIRLVKKLYKLLDSKEVNALVVPPSEARVMLSCSQKKLYQLINAGELKSFKAGKRSRKITVESINAYIASGCSKSKPRR